MAISTESPHQSLHLAALAVLDLIWQVFINKTDSICSVKDQSSNFFLLGEKHSPHEP